MKLNILNEIGHWRVIAGYPGSIVKGGVKSLSFLTHPSDRYKSPIYKKPKKKKR